MSHPRRETVPASNMQIPFCAIPRPGDRVLWYQDSLCLRGHLLGHKPSGEPYILNDFGGISVLPSFDYLRFEDPGRRLAPLWDRLPINGQIVQPLPDETKEFSRLLNQTTPPGPRYIDLVTEIWARGYEVFVVGGTVRDVISKAPTKDVDLVTSMPLIKAKPLLKSMYRQSENLANAAKQNGHLRLGGDLGSSDPFIDLCVFKYQLPGTADAIFGSDFQKDLDHRDFACNAIYYDPINNVLIDPSGLGIPDAETKTLRLICNRAMRSQFHIGQVVIRFFKFLCRGYTASETCIVELKPLLSPSLTAMSSSIRVGYIKTQILSKYPPTEHARRFEDFRVKFIEFGAEEVWHDLVEPLREEILA